MGRPAALPSSRGSRRNAKTPYYRAAMWTPLRPGWAAHESPHGPAGRRTFAPTH